MARDPIVSAVEISLGLTAAWAKGVAAYFGGVADILARAVEQSPEERANAWLRAQLRIMENYQHGEPPFEPKRLEKPRDGDA